jgi:hypothetical protein
MKNDKIPKLSVFDAVALLTDLPSERLVRGQVGTVVELLDRDALVEFSDDEGRAYAIARSPIVDLLVLHYEPRVVA